MKTIVVTTIFIILSTSAFAKTTLSWWQFWTDPNIKPVIEEMVSEFEKQNPDIDVELTDLTWANGHEKIVIAFASGTGPDIVELGSDWIAEFAVNGHLYDITSDISSTKSEYAGWGMSTYNDKIYAKPWFLGTRVVFANRALLNKAGYDSTFAPVTFTQFKEAVYKIDSLDKNIYGFGSNTAEKHRLYKKFLPFFWSYGATIFDDENRLCLVASDFAIKALQFYKDIHDSCGYVDTQRGIEDAFLDGKIGLIISGDWLLKRIENENRKFNLVSSLIPGEKYPGRSFLGGEFLAINKASDKKEAAVKFIDFITSPDNQVKFCKANRSANPSSKTACQDPYFASNVHLQTFIKQMNLAKHPPVDPDWVFIEEAIEKAVEEALFGDGLPATAMLEARYKIEEIKNK
ncbi:MAG: extracellular solute-binding protein [Calditrichaeota bacterium]|nr:MAG: extracellular solute-binding protein [Calditrichota bacterium]